VPLLAALQCINLAASIADCGSPWLLMSNAEGLIVKIDAFKNLLLVNCALCNLWKAITWVGLDSKTLRVLW